MHGPCLAVSFQYCTLIGFIYDIVGAEAEGTFLLFVVASLVERGARNLSLIRRTPSSLAGCRLGLFVLLALAISGATIIFCVGDASYRSYSGGISPSMEVIATGLANAQLYAAANFDAQPELARQRLSQMILCYIASIVCFTLGRVYRLYSLGQGKRQARPTRALRLVQLGIIAASLSLNGAYTPVLHISLACLRCIHWSHLDPGLVKQSAATGAHSVLSLGKPNVVFIQTDALSGSLMLKTAEGRAAMPFFQHLKATNDDFYVFDYARTVSGNTKDALLSLLAGCLPFTDQGKEIAFAQSIGDEFRTLGYETASFSSTNVNLQNTLWSFLEYHLVNSMDKVVDPGSAIGLDFANFEGSDDRQMLPYFEEWIQSEVNGSFYAQIYQINTHWPFVQNENSTAAHPYFSAMETVDYTLESIVRILNETGKLDNTIIVGVADHGEDALNELTSVRLHAQNPNIVHVPFYMYFPRHLFASDDERERLARNTKQVISTLDVFPTLQHILYGGDAGATKELRSRFSSSNLSSPSILRNCVTGLDLLDVDIPNERVTFGVNHVSVEVSQIHQWTIGSKDNVLLYREGRTTKRSRLQSIGLYEIHMNCTEAGDSCVSDIGKGSHEVRERWGAMMQWVETSSLVSENAKNSFFVKRFRKELDLE